MQSHVSTPGNSNIIFLLLCDLHSSTSLPSLMALFSYSLKCLLSYIACVFTCHCLRPWDASAEHWKPKQYYMSRHIRKFILREGMFISEFHQLIFHLGATEKFNNCYFSVSETLQKLCFYSCSQRVTDRMPFIYTFLNGSWWLLNLYKLFRSLNFDTMYYQLGRSVFHPESTDYQLS